MFEGTRLDSMPGVHLLDDGDDDGSHTHTQHGNALRGYSHGGAPVGGACLGTHAYAVLRCDARRCKYVCVCLRLPWVDIGRHAKRQRSRAEGEDGAEGWDVYAGEEWEGFKGGRDKGACMRTCVPSCALMGADRAGSVCVCECGRSKAAQRWWARHMPMVCIGAHLFWECTRVGRHGRAASRLRWGCMCLQG